uniref:ShKT domain-containing protein n=1 Tax=Steinernema glaseri TaxID=37863 RepID=A0A1I7Y3W1_9BILA
MFKGILFVVLLLTVAIDAQLPCMDGKCPPNLVCTAENVCEACKDVLPTCLKNKGLCQGKFKDFLKKQCPKTCGYC